MLHFKWRVAETYEKAEDMSKNKQTGRISVFWWKMGLKVTNDYKGIYHLHLR